MTNFHSFPGTFLCWLLSISVPLSESKLHAGNVGWGPSALDCCQSRFLWSGKETMLPSSPPLRTARESSPSSSSSLSNALERTRLHFGVSLAVELLMAGWMQQHAVFELIPASF
jgi:hypothetical protein